MPEQDNEGKIHKINCIDYMQQSVRKFFNEDKNWKSLMTAFLFGNARFRRKLYEIMEISFTKEDWFLTCGDEEDLINIYLLDQGILREEFGIDEYYKNVPIYGKRVKPDYKMDLFLINNKDRVIHLVETKFHPIRNGDLHQMARYISSLKNGKAIDIPQIARFKAYKTQILIIGIGKPRTLDKDLLTEADIYFLDERGKLHEYQGEETNPSQKNTDNLNLNIMKTSKYLDGVEWFKNNLA
jgi:hypothetical protein